jgi:hypothetical protein
VRRSSPRLRQVQFLALATMAVCALAIWTVGAAPVFGARDLQINGARFTSRTEVEALVGLDRSPNLFRFGTDRLAEELVMLPAVQTARVEIRLPSTIVVDIVEREPGMIWVIGSHRYVVDQGGLLFGLVDEAGNPIASDAGPLQPTPSPSPSATAQATATAAGAHSPAPPARPSLASVPTVNPGVTPGSQAMSGLPIVFDRRAVSAKWGLGSRVDAVNLDAGYRLGNLKPADLGSTATALTVVLDDDHGFTVSATPASWVAEFGFYTPNRRKDTVIPTQIRDLGLMFTQFGESHVGWAFLWADISDAHQNSYLPR